MTHTALIVDDSRTALAVLNRMLVARGLNVDTVESGTEALRFLHAQLPPAVIFLDHMMPGMDGFETLRQIKRDPLLADIPVVMYTSQEGETYLGEAAALGAVAVLRKPVASVDVDEILSRLRLVGATDGDSGSRTTTLLPPAPSGTAAGDVGKPLDTSADSVADKVMPPDFDFLPPPVRAPSLAWRLGRGLLLFGLVGTCLWLFQQYREADTARARAVAEVEQMHALWRERLAQRETRRATSNAPIPATDVAHTQALLETLSWALSRGGGFDFEQPPFDDERARMVRDLVVRLSAAGFRGTVQLEAHIGEFCATRDAQGNPVLPPPTAPFARCEVQTHPPGHALTLGLRQSPGFARYIASLNVAAGPVQVTVVSHGSSRPAHPYPEPDAAHTAGDWNAVARLNQRIEVVLRPALR